MATLTAQVLVGSAHPNHGGIEPTHYIFLSENSRPAWLLLHQNIFKEASDDVIATWIPTVENMLEDLLVMIAIHICQDRQVIELAKSFCTKIESDRIELYSDFEASQRQQLYQKCRNITDFPKIIISVFSGSTIERQLPILEQYQMVSLLSSH
jgi:hypothetical protein